MIDITSVACLVTDEKNFLQQDTTNGGKEKDKREEHPFKTSRSGRILVPGVKSTSTASHARYSKHYRSIILRLEDWVL